MTDKEWIKQNAASLSTQYPDKWIAVKDGAVVATADTRHLALGAAVAAGKTNAALYKAQ